MLSSPSFTKEAWRILRIIEKYRALISKLKKNDNAPKIRLLGDEVADRGHNDLLTLLLLDKLHKDKTDVKINLSNHALWFIQYLEKGEVSQSATPKESQRRSLLMLHSLMQKVPGIKEEVQKIYKESYLPMLKAFSYSENKDDSLSFFTHAPGGRQAVRHWAEFYKLKDCDTGQLEQRKILIQCLNTIDQHFETLKKSGTITDEYKNTASELAVWQKKIDELGEKVKEIETRRSEYVENFTKENPGKSRFAAPEYGKFSKEIEEVREKYSDALYKAALLRECHTLSPIADITWNRSGRSRYLDRPETLKDGTRIIYIHGHDNDSAPPIVNLDNHLGKSGANIGTYTVYYVPTKAGVKLSPRTVTPATGAVAKAPEPAPVAKPKPAPEPAPAAKPAPKAAPAAEPKPDYPAYEIGKNPAPNTHPPTWFNPKTVPKGNPMCGAGGVLYAKAPDGSTYVLLGKEKGREDDPYTEPGTYCFMTGKVEKDPEKDPEKVPKPQSYLEAAAAEIHQETAEVYKISETNLESYPCVHLENRKTKPDAINIPLTYFIKADYHSSRTLDRALTNPHLSEDSQEMTEYQWVKLSDLKNALQGWSCPYQTGPASQLSFAF